MDMTNKEWEMGFVEELCELLEKHQFGDSYEHNVLVSSVLTLIESLRKSKPGRSNLCVWESKGDWAHMVERVRAFGYDFVPDVSVNIGNKPYIAIEVKPVATSESKAKLKSGIAQALIYATKYDYVILLYRDKVKLPSAAKRELDDRIVTQVWNQYRIRLIVRYEREDS